MNTRTFINRHDLKRLLLVVLASLLAAVCLALCVSCNAAFRLDGITAVYNGQAVLTGATLDKSDVEVTAKYTNGTSKKVTDFDLDYNFAVAGECAVTVTYVEKEVTKRTSFNVTVTNPPEPPKVTLESITAVYNGGTLDNADISVTAFYSNDTDKPVTNFSVGGFSSAQAGVCTVTVSYTENGVTEECTLNVTVVEDSSEVVVNSNLSVHFVQFENQSSGDCVYIKAGETDILIDAGSTTGSAKTIDSYIKEYVTDGKLEYVIATHAHEDHVSAFYGTDSTPGIMDRYECGTIIRYAQSNSNSSVRTKFESKCDEQVSKGAKLYTALECVNNSNGAQKVYDLTGDGNITMEVLEHKYYASKSSDENDHSVCVVINQKLSNDDSNHYLFTGDLEESGEKSLVQLNPDLPEMVLFKGGHHGSYTASNDVLLSKIKPQYVCICCCAGNVEYLKQAPQNLSHSFPAQEMIDRVAKYTDRVYVTTRGFIRWDESKNKYFNDGYEPMNGNIVFSCVNGEVTLNCSNNNLKLKDTEWFKNNRQCPPEWQETSD